MPDYLTSPTCWVICLGGLLGTLMLTPLVMRLAWRLDAVDRGGYRKINHKPIPLMGGLAIALPFLATCLLGILRPTGMLRLLANNLDELCVIAFGGVVILALGVADDFLGLRARHKFLVQFAVAAMVCVAGKAIFTIDLPLLGHLELGWFLGSILTVLWIVGVMNAFNLVDGMDGLASGLALIASLGLGVIAMFNGNTFTVILCLVLSASLLAFLLFNFHPAKIFLGDTGSLFLGYVMAMLSLMGASRTTGTVMLLAPMLALGFPIFDTISSMMRRILRGRNPFIGDRLHTHHRLLDHGYTQRQATLILYAVALTCTLSAVLCQLLYPKEKGPLLAIGLYVLIVLAVARANGYLRPRQMVRLSRCRERNSKLALFAQYASLSINSASSGVGLQDILQLCCKEMNLRFIEVGLEGAGIPATLAQAELERACAVPTKDPIETLRVRHGERALVVRYQLNHDDLLAVHDEDARENDVLEHEDVMACLAQLFELCKIEAIELELSGGDPVLAPVHVGVEN